MIRRVAGAAAAARRTDLGRRALAGVVMVVVALVLLALGGWPFWLFVVAVSAAMLAEWAGLMHAPMGRTRVAVLLYVLALFAATPALFGPNRDAVALLASAAIVVALALGSVRLGSGLAYVGLPAIGLLYLRTLPGGFWLALWVLAVVAATDTGAYFAGRAIGGPKLAPRLSPSKTWAGLLGGAVAALVLGAALAVAGRLPAAFLGLGGVMAVLAQMGDLFESWLKRRAGVKDSGRILPGHGGVLDRADGLVPVAALVAALIAGHAL
ncbi:phosphatidate cytidylyltransferase [Sphingomonas jatrophae]|uniref:Phosphatidate cytidylyltransferase n=1 Tax=Sphingomonas jatrophae TaxID=1166337 RepID=A0A1I6JPN3_9SPHN|nr:phosphatidate cytidylyltransferase [Sphingomonas jatrophae]SFR80871.1 phosphatidate cytidylyltransferase [Sphingomonas jatrophae]